MNCTGSRSPTELMVILITYKALNGIAPSYISELLKPHQTQRNLRSSNVNVLAVPKVLHKQSGEAAFAHYAPKLWNTLPLCMKQASSVDIFKKTPENIPIYESV